MLHEIGYSVRSLLRTPAITAAAVLTLAMTLGATLCAADARQRRHLASAPDRGPGPRIRTAPAERRPTAADLHVREYERLQHQLRDSVTGISGSGTRAVRLTVADQTENGTAVFAGAGYFTVAGLRPAVGRMFSPEDHAPGAEATAVITDTLWRTRFGASPHAIGSRLRLNGKPVLIIGVAPRFLQRDAADGAGGHLRSARDRANAAAAGQLLRRGPDRHRRARILAAGLAGDHRPAAPWHGREDRRSARVGGHQSGVQRGKCIERTVRAQRRCRAAATRAAGHGAFTSYLGAIVAAIWLIGCATLAALMISRNDLRQRELAVRAALGASRWAVARLVLWDVALISGAAACGAWALAHVIVGSLESFALPGGIRISRLHFDDARAAVAAAALAGLATLVSAGILPVLLSRQQDVASELKAANGRATGHTRAKAMLVVAQVAVSCILLVGAGLFIRSVQAVNGMDLGPDVRQLVYATVNYSGNPAQPAALAAAVTSAVASVRALPGVQSVTYGGLPLVSDGGSNQVFTVDGAERVLPDTMIFDCGADYFATVGIPLLEGRDFTAADAQ
jgi:putative ABC transport system permease protein